MDDDGLVYVDPILADIYYFGLHQRILESNIGRAEGANRIHGRVREKQQDNDK